MSGSLIELPEDLRALVESELEPGEPVGYVGQPIPCFFTGASIAPFLFAIPWTAFAIFWICWAAGFHWPDFSKEIGPQHLFPLYGLPFVIAGLVMLSTPLRTYCTLRRTVCVITDHRAVLFTGGPWTSVRSFRPDQLREIRRRERRDGSGDVLFSPPIEGLPPAGILQWLASAQRGEKSFEPGFIRVRDAKAVEAILRELVRAATPAD